MQLLEDVLSIVDVQRLARDKMVDHRLHVLVLELHILGMTSPWVSTSSVIRPSESQTIRRMRDVWSARSLVIVFICLTVRSMLLIVLVHGVPHLKLLPLAMVPGRGAGSPCELDARVAGVFCLVRFARVLVDGECRHAHRVGGERSSGVRIQIPPSPVPNQTREKFVENFSGHKGRVERYRYCHLNQAIAAYTGTLVYYRYDRTSTRVMDNESCI